MKITPFALAAVLALAHYVAPPAVQAQQAPKVKALKASEGISKH